ncbi:DNA-directed RNA polymerase subunit omega [Marispirochaeta aestuarii]|uniref:DNA-directed RNA polymerase subunit omega n=1 Tax=Marispirochaeta aestuarii TaxID=1963862 RepID=UPI0029C9602D|nr:DNA-directed RNA polymerase subunit omega [Marispirochaeta aestuarii]
MIIPLDLLVDNTDNVYEMTCAAIRRAVQVTITGDEELEEDGGKIVSTAIKQVLTRTVQYRLEE